MTNIPSFPTFYPAKFRQYGVLAGDSDTDNSEISDGIHYESSEDTYYPSSDNMSVEYDIYEEENSDGELTEVYVPRSTPRSTTAGDKMTLPQTENNIQIKPPEPDNPWIKLSPGLIDQGCVVWGSKLKDSQDEKKMTLDVYDDDDDDYDLTSLLKKNDDIVYDKKQEKVALSTPPTILDPHVTVDDMNGFTTVKRNKTKNKTYTPTILAPIKDDDLIQENEPIINEAIINEAIINEPVKDEAPIEKEERRKPIENPWRRQLPKSIIGSPRKPVENNLLTPRAPSPDRDSRESSRNDNRDSRKFTYRNDAYNNRNDAHNNRNDAHSDKNYRDNMLCRFQSSHSVSCTMSHSIMKWNPSTCKYDFHCKKGEKCIYYHPSRESKDDFFNRITSVENSSYMYKFRVSYKKTYRNI